VKLIFATLTDLVSFSSSMIVVLSDDSKAAVSYNSDSSCSIPDLVVTL